MPLMEIDSSQRRSSAADAEAPLTALPCQSFLRRLMMPPTPMHLSAASGLGTTAGAKEKIQFFGALVENSTVLIFISDSHSHLLVQKKDLFLYTFLGFGVRMFQDGGERKEKR